MFYYLVLINVILKKIYLLFVFSICIIMEVLYNNLFVISKYFIKIDLFRYIFIIYLVF